MDVQVAPHTSFVELKRLQLGDITKKHGIIPLTNPALKTKRKLNQYRSSGDWKRRLSSSLPVAVPSGWASSRRDKFGGVFL